MDPCVAGMLGGGSTDGGDGGKGGGGPTVETPSEAKTIHKSRRSSRPFWNDLSARHGG